MRTHSYFLMLPHSHSLLRIPAVKALRLFSRMQVHLEFSQTFVFTHTHERKPVQCMCERGVCVLLQESDKDNGGRGDGSIKGPLSFFFSQFTFVGDEKPQWDIEDDFILPPHQKQTNKGVDKIPPMALVLVSSAGKRGGRGRDRRQRLFDRSR